LSTLAHLLFSDERGDPWNAVSEDKTYGEE